jgi:inorganic pyrophosphatase
VMNAAANAVITAPNDAAMMTATASSTTLPRMMKSRNSLSTTAPLPLVGMLADSMAGTDSLHCLVEVPKGSRNKYEWDDRLQAIKLARFLFSSVVYPTDYGFIQGTLSEKGTALDAMVCVSAPTFPGIVIPVKVIAVFRTRDEAGQDDKLLCVPHEDPNWNHMEQLEDIPQTLRTEIEHFWSIYKEPEGKPVEIQGWEGRDCAEDVIAAGRRRKDEAG